MNSEQDKKYTEAVGRRKTSSARVRLFPSKGGIEINGKGYKEYFKIARQRVMASAPLELTGVFEEIGASVKVKGGGLNSQAEAVRHGLARALAKHNEELKKKMRQFGFLTRDPRVVERKKYGLKKARRAPQWSKR